MKKLFSSADRPQVELLHNRLQSAGIQCELRNEYVGAVLTVAPFFPEIWVLDDEEFTKAEALMADWNQSTPSTESEDAGSGESDGN